MEDTTQTVKDLYRNILMSKTEEERFLMCANMYSAGIDMIVSTMPAGLSEQDQKRYIYERTYGEPLPEDFFDRKK
jgi:biotin synthase-like enzyme